MTDALYTRVEGTDNKLHYSIRNGHLLAQNTNGYENLYIPVRPRAFLSLQMLLLCGLLLLVATDAPGLCPILSVMR